MFGMDLFFKSAAAGMKIAQIGVENMVKMVELFAGLSCQANKPSNKETPDEKKATSQVSTSIEKAQNQDPPIPFTSADVKPKSSSEDLGAKSITPVPAPQSPPPQKIDIKKEKKERSQSEKASSKKKSPTATDKVREYILQQPQGVTADDIMKATGYPKKKIQDILYKLKKRGILNTEKGIYTKV